MERLNYKIRDRYNNRCINWNKLWYTYTVSVIICHVQLILYSEQVPIPTKIISRLQHSACVVKLSSQCIYLVLFGGISAWKVGQSLTDQPMKADTAVIEMSEYLFYRLNM